MNIDSRDYHLLVQNDTELGLTKTLAARVIDGTGLDFRRPVPALSLICPQLLCISKKKKGICF
jgi:hypothetical protein